MKSTQISNGVLKKLRDMGFAANVKAGEWTFTHTEAEEGIIVPREEQEVITNFAYLQGEREEGEASSEVIATATELLYEDLYPKTERQKLGPHAEVATVVEDGRSTVIDKITKRDLELRTNTIETLLMMQTTDKTYIKTRPGPKKTTLSYVDGTYMTRALNFAFLFDWSFEVPETRQDGDFFTALGLLTVNLDGKTITKSQWGSQKMRAGMEPGDALKGATTDALKKCASMFGIAADVYAGEV